MFNPRLRRGASRLAIFAIVAVAGFAMPATAQAEENDFVIPVVSPLTGTVSIQPYIVVDKVVPQTETVVTAVPDEVKTDTGSGFSLGSYFSRARHAVGSFFSGLIDGFEWNMDKDKAPMPLLLATWTTVPADYSKYGVAAGTKSVASLPEPPSDISTASGNVRFVNKLGQAGQTSSAYSTYTGGTYSGIQTWSSAQTVSFHEPLTTLANCGCAIQYKTTGGVWINVLRFGTVVDGGTNVYTDKTVSSVQAEPNRRLKTTTECSDNTSPVAYTDVYVRTGAKPRIVPAKCAVSAKATRVTTVEETQTGSTWGPGTTGNNGLTGPLLDFVIPDVLPVHVVKVVDGQNTSCSATDCRSFSVTDTANYKCVDTAGTTKALTDCEGFVGTFTAPQVPVSENNCALMDLGCHIKYYFVPQTGALEAPMARVKASVQGSVIGTAVTIVSDLTSPFRGFTNVDIVAHCKGPAVGISVPTMTGGITYNEKKFYPFDACADPTKKYAAVARNIEAALLLLALGWMGYGMAVRQFGVQTPGRRQ